MTSRTLGFSRLAQIRPDSDTNAGPPDHAIDQVADRVGFPSREATEKIVKRQVNRTPTAALAFRPPVDVYNRFVQFSIDNRLTYAEALAHIMKQAGI